MEGWIEGKNQFLEDLEADNLSAGSHLGSSFSGPVFVKIFEEIW